MQKSCSVCINVNCTSVCSRAVSSLQKITKPRQGIKQTKTRFAIFALNSVEKRKQCLLTEYRSRSPPFFFAEVYKKNIVLCLGHMETLPLNSCLESYQITTMSNEPVFNVPYCVQLLSWQKRKSRCTPLRTELQGSEQRRERSCRGRSIVEKW